MATPSAHLLNAASLANLSSFNSKTSRRRLPSKLARHVLVVSLFLIVLGAALPSSATTYKVTSLVDNSSSLTTAGTLRYSLANAASGDTIVFSVTGTITLDCTDPGDGPLVISQNVTISGPGAAKLAISGGLPSATACQVFVVNAAVTATISGVTIENGICTNSPICLSGGGIQNSGTLTVSNSTLSGNSAGVGELGGGIFNSSGGTLTVSNSTLSGNSGGVYTSNGGGGIFNDGGTLTVSNSTLSANSADPRRRHLQRRHADNEQQHPVDQHRRRRPRRRYLQHRHPNDERQHPVGQLLHHPRRRRHLQRWHADDEEHASGE